MSKTEEVALQRMGAAFAGPQLPAPIGTDVLRSLVAHDPGILAQGSKHRKSVHSPGTIQSGSDGSDGFDGSKDHKDQKKEGSRTMNAVTRPPFATLGPVEAAAEYGPDPEEIALPAGATSLDLLRAVYRDPRQPMARRMRAATVAISFEHPKLSVSASFNTGFGRRMEANMERLGQRAVIDARPAKAEG